MNRNIEVGCLVIVYGLKVDVEFNGMSGECVGIIQEGGEYKGINYIGEGDAWLVSNGSFFHGVEPFGPSNLLRIDSYDASTDTVTTEQEQTA